LVQTWIEIGPFNSTRIGPVPEQTNEALLVSVCLGLERAEERAEEEAVAEEEEREDGMVMVGGARWPAAAR
jgi:hypothetical protein